MTEDRIDRYVRGELTAAEARALAQESLDSPELFDELTFSAVAKKALPARFPAQNNVVRFPRKARFAAALAAVAATVVVVSFYAVRSPREIPPLKPALASSAKPGQPILLASNVESQPDTVFRGAEASSRAPSPSGSIVSIEDGLATISLGALDSVAKGAELQIFRDERSAEPIGRLVVTTVFRERARGRILNGRGIRVNDQVRVSDAIHVNALLEQVDGLSGRGDKDAARTMAEKALQWAESKNVPQEEKRKVQERLAALENDRAVLSILGGNYAAADAPLNRAASFAYGRSLNNLGVLAELRGDRRKAEALYADALRAFETAPAQERQAVEENLARVKGSH